MLGIRSESFFPWITHNILHINNKSVFIVWTVHKVRIRGDCQEGHLRVNLAQVDEECKIFEDEVKCLLGCEFVTVVNELFQVLIEKLVILRQSKDTFFHCC